MSEPMTSRLAWPTLKRDLVAILRGLTPDDCEAVVAGLIDGRRLGCQALIEGDVVIDAVATAGTHTMFSP